MLPRLETVEWFDNFVGEGCAVHLLGSHVDIQCFHVDNCMCGVWWLLYQVPAIELGAFALGRMVGCKLHCEYHCWVVIFPFPLPSLLPPCCIQQNLWILLVAAPSPLFPYADVSFPRLVNGYSQPCHRHTTGR